MEPQIIGQTIEHGKQRWRKNIEGSWFALAFGTFPFKDTPHGEWIHVPENKVPEAVKRIKERKVK